MTGRKAPRPAKERTTLPAAEATPRPRAAAPRASARRTSARTCVLLRAPAPSGLAVWAALLVWPARPGGRLAPAAKSGSELGQEPGKRVLLRDRRAGSSRASPQAFHRVRD